MTGWELVGLVAAGFGAGAINAAVGSGTLITFPALLAVGLPPVSANVTNTVGLVPGSAAAVVGYRRELRDQWPTLRLLAPASILGGVTGAGLLRALPPEVFAAVVPVLLLLSCALLLLQRPVTRWLRGRARGGEPMTRSAVVAAYAVGIYGGYFGAAQGILLLAALGILLEPDLQRANAVKNVLAALANLVAAAVFTLGGDVRWGHAAVVAAGAVTGGFLGAGLARRLPDALLRALVVVVGLVAVAALLG